MTPDPVQPDWWAPHRRPRHPWLLALAWWLDDRGWRGLSDRVYRVRGWLWHWEDSR